MKRTFTLLACLLTYHSTFVAAQTFQNIPIPAGLGGTSGRIVAADIDNDGDPDGIVTFSGGLSILKYNAGTFTRTNNNNISFSPYIFSIDAGDVNRDGYIDIMHAGRSDFSNEPLRVLLLNNGTQLVPSGNQLLGDGAYAGSLYFGDVEGDGDLDVLSMNGVLLNRNNAINSYGPRLAKSGSWATNWWDLNKDSKLDVLQIWGYPGSGAIMGNHIMELAYPTMSISTELTLGNMPLWLPAVGDYDADGDLDMLVQYDQSFHIFKNNNGNFSQSGISFALGLCAEFADMNNDGLYDVVVGASTQPTYQTFIYTQKPDGTFNHTPVLITGTENSRIALADYDNDGDLDLFGAGGAYKNTTAAVNGRPAAPSFTGQNVSGSSVELFWAPGGDDKTPVNSLTYNISVRSEDGSIIVPPHALASGRRQLYKIGNAWNSLSFDLSCLKAGKYFWSVQTLDASYQGSEFSVEKSFTIEKEPPVTPANFTATPVADNGILLSWEDHSTTEDGFIIFRALNETPNDFYPIDTVMANSTHYLDTTNILREVQPEKTYHYRVAASNCAYPDEFITAVASATSFPRAFVNSNWLNLGNVAGSLALLGDCDRDKDLDLLLTYSGSNNTKLFRFNGTGYEDSGIQFNVAATEASWIDYNKDGFIDVILSHNVILSNSNISLFRNDAGTGFTLVEKALPPNIVTHSGIMVGDYDKDGDEDMVVQATSSTIHVYENDGVGNFTRNQDITLNGYFKGANALGDYDNDGDLDILANKEISCDSHIITVFEQTSPKTFVSVQYPELVGLNDAAWDDGDMAWGDYDNDGYLDMMVAGQHICSNGVAIHKVYRNNKNKIFSQGSSLAKITYDVDVDWGDYDNDGDYDIFAYGDPFGGLRGTSVYRNDEGKFRKTNITYLLESVQRGKAAPGDIDNDGDLDYVILGAMDYVSDRIFAYQNTYAEGWGRPNSKPSTPVSANSEVHNDQSVTLTWGEANDEQTPTTGLSYNIYVMNEDDVYVVNSYSTEDGSRMIVSSGNVPSGTSLELKNLKPGTYRWGVQSIDKGFAASSFTEQKIFEVLPVTGIDDELIGGVALFPNPVLHDLTTISNETTSSRIEISNLIGNTVMKIKLDKGEHKHDLSSLQPGLYLVSVYQNGVKVGVRKLIRK